MKCARNGGNIVLLPPRPHPESCVRRECVRLWIIASKLKCPDCLDGHVELGTFEAVVSQHILTKVEEAWGKPYFRTFLTDEEIAVILIEVTALASIVTPVDDVHGVAEDDEDDLALATAVAAKAEYLVTGDKYLLRIGEFRNIPIVSPREFLHLMPDMP